MRLEIALAAIAGAVLGPVAAGCQAESVRDPGGETDPSSLQSSDASQAGQEAARAGNGPGPDASTSTAGGASSMGSAGSTPGRPGPGSRDAGAATAGAGGQDDPMGEAGSAAGQTGSGGSASGSGGGGGDQGTPALDCTLRWSSGFENGFPGEWHTYDNGSYSANGTVPSGFSDAWTIISEDSGEPVFSGEHAYKGWITGAASDLHRPYPVVYLDLPTPVINTFMVYLDLDYEEMEDAEWMHFGTWGSEAKWALHTMAVRRRVLELAHTDPSSGEFLGDGEPMDFPLRRWVRFTVYAHYEGSTGFVQVWQDGVPMLRGEVVLLADYPGTTLERAHWGLYAPAVMDHGVQYNDDIGIWTLSQPLTDLETEPDCYLGGIGTP